MLSIYCSRADGDTEALLFSKIKESLGRIRRGESKAKRVLLVVPAQFTLKAEEKAFSFLNENGFFDFHIMSGNKLNRQILNETGGTGFVPVNTLGRAMLLRKIAKDKGPTLKAFGKVADSGEFLKLVGDFIVQLRQNDFGAADLEKIKEAAARDGLLYNKLSDMQVFTEAYTSAMEGRFTDSEDTLLTVTEHIKKSEWIKSSEIWYYDFYSFTKRECLFMGELMEQAVDLSVVMMTGDASGADGELFRAPNRAMDMLADQAERRGVPRRIYPPEQAFARPGLSPALAHIERQLYAMPSKAFPGCPGKSLRLVRSATPFSQAETIAADILTLVRDNGYTYDDIAILTNDTEGSAATIKRVFESYGIPIFNDEKRAVLHSPAVELLSALLDMVADDYRTQDILRFIKPGLVDLNIDAEEKPDLEEFENYCIQYHIKSSKLLKPFKYGAAAMGDSGLARVEAIRAALAALLSPFRGAFTLAETVRDKLLVLYSFLTESLHLPDKLSEISVILAESGLPDAAEETSQIWGIVVSLMDQAVELLGDEVVSVSDLRDILSDAFLDIKVGLLPQTTGRVVVGTVNRSRVPGVKAIFLAGVNDGILPKEAATEAILTSKEIRALEAVGYTLYKSDAVLSQEEQLMIYKAFTTPTDILWVGYLASDTDGKELKPSSLVLKLKEIFPELREEEDIENTGNELSFIQGVPGAVNRLTYILRAYMSGELREIPPIWQKTYNIMLMSHSERLKAMRTGLFFTNSVAPLTKSEVARLYNVKSDGCTVSPSRLEQFVRCPFMHFVSYGLKPLDKKSFEVSGREIGDIHHGCLMRLSAILSKPSMDGGFTITDPRSLWMTVTDEQMVQYIDTILDDMAEKDFDGLLKSGKPEQYRTKRTRAVLLRFARSMISHVRQGNIEKIFFETPFNQRAEAVFPPVTIKTDRGNVRVVGIIDRVDILPAGEGKSPWVKVVDYKSGHLTFDRELVAKGLSLQLMLYLESATGGPEAYRPAGVFYYKISDDMKEAKDIESMMAGDVTEAVQKKIDEVYRLDGLLVNESEALNGIDKELPQADNSNVISIKKDKDGEITGKNVVSVLDFQQLRQEFLSALTEACTRLLEGDAAAAPRILGKGSFTGGDKVMCDYCAYNSICTFDKAFDACRYH